MMYFKLSRGHWVLGLLFLTLPTSYSWIQKPNSENKSLPLVLSTHWYVVLIESQRTTMWSANDYEIYLFIESGSRFLPTSLYIEA